MEEIINFPISDLLHTLQDECGEKDGEEGGHRQQSKSQQVRIIIIT